MARAKKDQIRNNDFRVSYFLEHYDDVPSRRVKEGKFNDFRVSYFLEHYDDVPSRLIKEGKLGGFALTRKT